jgi:hypothetical protein
MYRKTLASALALTVFSAAFNPSFAVSLNPRGIGEALIYPYYTVNKNQNTLISVVNPSDVGKAVQVRFREGYNGRDDLGFVLYLAPGDVWTASMSESSFDGARLKTSDKSCTSPPFPDDGVPLSSAGYDGTSPGYPADAGPQDLSRTREGSIELIVGADIKPGSATAVAIDASQSGLPSCTGLATMPLADLEAPKGGIYGSASIVDVGEGTFFAYNADALGGFTRRQLFSAASPLGPTLADANSAESTLGGAVARVAGNAGPLTLDYAAGIDAVSAALMANLMYDEYFVDAGFGASTDWIVTFPTKNFYVDKALYPTGPTAPFEQAFSTPGISNVSVAWLACDREQHCGPIATSDALSYQVNAIAIRSGGALDDPSGVFGSRQVSLTIPPSGSAGNILMNLAGDAGLHELTGGHEADGSPYVLGGLPVVGFMAYNIVNENAQQGVLANYGGTFPLRAESACDNAAGDCL